MQTSLFRELTSLLCERRRNIEDLGILLRRINRAQRPVSTAQEDRTASPIPPALTQSPQLAHHEQNRPFVLQTVPSFATTSATSLGRKVRDNEVSATSLGGKVRDKEVNATSLGKKVRDDEVNATSLGRKVRDDEVSATSLGRKVRDDEGRGGKGGLSRLRREKPGLNCSAPAFSGEGGIRTREPLWEVTRFPDAPLQPLEHLSFAVCGCKYKQKYVNFVILSGKLN